MSAIALSIACVAIARLWVTSPTMELGSVPLMALSSDREAVEQRS
jgi:hypothetical protein